MSTIPVMDLVREMKQHLVRAGVDEEKINIIINTVFYDNDIYTHIIGIHREEFKKFMELWLLAKPEQWDYWIAHGGAVNAVKRLRDAQRALKTAWQKRVAVFLRKEDK